MDVNEVLADLKAAFETQAEEGAYDAQLDEFMENEVVPVWQGFYPEDTGAGRDSVKVTKSAQGGKGQCGATDEVANIIEFGSEDTEEFAPRARTEAHFRSRGQ